MSAIKAIDALLYLSGYDWGPGVSKVIFTLSEPVESVKQEGSSITTASKERKIISLYLSDDKGNKMTQISNHISIELGILFDSDINPFYYDTVTRLNEWNSKFIINASFYVNVKGKDYLISFEKDCINNRICPDTEKFAIRSKFSGNYMNPLTKKEQLITIHYGAYEPKELKDDNAKNPLIVWLHGQGEGGNDVDITLMGTKTTSLAGSKIQSHFTTKNGSKGAYVLILQCPTYWMDGGDGVVRNGDVECLYTKIVMDTIKQYLLTNPDIDTNRIYIGGCSNGAYMATEMMISYPDYWAASFQSGQLYPYKMFKRDDKGNYIYNEERWFPSNVYQTDTIFCTDEKINAIKHIPLWLVQSEDDPIIDPTFFSFPIYKKLLKAGNKNCWYTYYKTVEGTDIPGLKFNGHFSWIAFFDDEIMKVQDPIKVLNSNDNSYGFVPSDEGGSQKATDEKGSYESIWAWLNSQVKK